MSRLALLAVFFLTGLTASAQEAKPPVYKAPELKPIAQKLPAVFDKESPESVADLKAMQDHVAKIVEKVMPAVVCVRVGAAFGSGVIVSKDGHVLTAGHVSGKPYQDVKLFFADGKTAKGKTLGGNHGIDSGMIKITDPGNWPYADMGDCTELKRGHWCMVVAHPGGFKPGRTPPVRLGRVLKVTDSTLTTDCILVGGDSGGPLFDMHGRVIGINSRIGQQLTANLHVPVNPFRDHWEKIAASEVWGGKLGAAPHQISPVYRRRIRSNQGGMRDPVDRRRFPCRKGRAQGERRDIDIRREKGRGRHRACRPRANEKSRRSGRTGNPPRRGDANLETEDRQTLIRANPSVACASG